MKPSHKYHKDTAGSKRLKPKSLEEKTDTFLLRKPIKFINSQVYSPHFKIIFFSHTFPYSKTIYTNIHIVSKWKEWYKMLAKYHFFQYEYVHVICENGQLHEIFSTYGQIHQHTINPRSVNYLFFLLLISRENDHLQMQNF